MRRLLPLVLLAATGCATSLASGHSAKVLDKGQLEVTVGGGLMVPAGVLAKAFGDGKDVAEKLAKQQAQDGQIKTDRASAETALIAAAAVIAAPPAPVTELTVRYGLLDRLDVGLRYSGPAFRSEVHGQVLDGPWKVAVGAAVAHHAFEGPILDLLEKFDLASFSRNDVELEVLAGREWELGAIYAGPKAVYSKYSSDGLLVNGDKLAVETPGGPAAEVSFDLSHSFIYGGLVGGRVGWKYVWLTAELGVYGSTYKPNILGAERHLGGLIVYPAIGLAGRY